MGRKTAAAKRTSIGSRHLAEPAPRWGEPWTPAYDLWTLSRFASGVSRLRPRRRAAARAVVIALFIVPLAMGLFAFFIHQL
jgi:hypothetical protein